MRKFTEPSARNLLRRPLVMGVPIFGLVGLSFITLGIFILLGSTSYGNGGSIAIGCLGYAVLRVISRFAHLGWEEAVIFYVERLVRTKAPGGKLETVPSSIQISSPDVLEPTDLMNLKETLEESITHLKQGQRLNLVCEVGTEGARLHEVRVSGRFDLSKKQPWERLVPGLITGTEHIYTLIQLPVVTDPLWLFGILSKIQSPFKVFVSIAGTEPRDIKRRIEISRRSNAQGTSGVSNIDADVTFEEASAVLQGISRGEETVVELAWVIASCEPLELDESLFCKETNKALAILSVLGIRKRFHRSHCVRAITATDLIPNVLDPVEEGSAILKTLRSMPLYFSPQDSRLEALHWLVVGASGSGKSFFTGLVLKRMIEQGCPMSVLFIDHNRSFRRLVRSSDGPYLEPATLRELETGTSRLLDTWNAQGTVSGIELSDLNLDEKKAAIQFILSRVEAFLRFRDSTHPLYLVLDECWNFMRDEPLLVQRAFREFRKLNGAVIAITQSLHDFLTDQSGQSICQNAPIRILLRQGEDLNRYQGILSLNSVELLRASRLKQQKGLYSECLIKTPFLSRVGRLYPTTEEHDLLRTDNLRAELIQEAKIRRQGGIECVSTSAC